MVESLDPHLDLIPKIKTRANFLSWAIKIDYFKLLIEIMSDKKKPYIVFNCKYI